MKTRTRSLLFIALAAATGNAAAQDPHASHHGHHRHALPALFYRPDAAVSLGVHGDAHRAAAGGDGDPNRRHPLRMVSEKL